MPRVPGGITFKGRYQIDSFLKDGGMGETYKGTDIKTGKKVVLKFVKYFNDGNDSLREDKLKVESEILKKLRHPYIVRYEDEGIDPNYGFFLILEFIEGRNLNAEYHGKACTEKELYKICAELLDVVGYLHNKNVLHRDISPDNIMLNKKGDIVLIDFGAAKEGFVGLNQNQVTTIGKNNYSAPEQLLGYPTYQSDIFSIGATMWFLVTGQPPRNRTKQGRILSVKYLNRNVPDNIDSVILKATEQDFAARFQNTNEMLQALKSLSGKNIQYPRIIHANKIFKLRDGENVITRKKSSLSPILHSGILIDDPNNFISSRGQAKIFKNGGKWFVQNLATISETNKTYVFENGRYVPVDYPRELRDGDTLSLCYSYQKGPYMTVQFKMW